MMLGRYIPLAIALLSSSVSGGQQEGMELAHMLADPGSRNSAVTTLQTSGRGKIPLLLTWTQKPPSGVNEVELYMGLADAFGALKTEEALPFLIRQIDLNQFPYTDVWTRTPGAVLERLPAVRALIQIGPAASRAVMHAYPSFSTGNERLAAIFVVSRIEGVAEAQRFLTAVVGQAKAEQVWAEEGLKNLRAPSDK